MSTDTLPLKPPSGLSPTSITTFQQCPAKFKFAKIDKLPDPSGIEATLGKFVHEVLEHLYKLPQEERTLDMARAYARMFWERQWAREARVHLKTTVEERQFRWQAWWCIENLWKLENPAEVTPSGLEYKFKGEIAGIPVRGVIDRWGQGENGASITDYKTGKTPAKRYRDDKFFQLLIYAIALGDQLGQPVTDLELLYLKGGDRLVHTATDEDIERTTATVVKVQEDILERCDTGEFETKPSRLCDWCPYKQTVCPYWIGQSN